MKFLMLASAILALAVCPATFAQTQNRTSSSQAPSQHSANSNQNLAAAQQIQQDLKKAGFTDVKVVAESFVVQAKTKDGNPVVMTIGPHGMSVFEAMNGTSGSAASSGGSTTASARSPQGSK
jgi:glucose/arabinose dehydrogenase